MDALSRGTDVILRLDVQGAATVRQLLPHAISIFLVRVLPTVYDIQNPLLY